MKFAERLRQERILNGYNQTYIAKYMSRVGAYANLTL